MTILSPEVLCFPTNSVLFLIFVVDMLVIFTNAYNRLPPLHIMTQLYQKECIYCKQMITMSDETGKWLPYNKDNSAHDCRTTKTNGTTTTKTNGQNQKKYTLDDVRKKLESIGIIVNVERLMTLKK